MLILEITSSHTEEIFKSQIQKMGGLSLWHLNASDAAAALALGVAIVP